MVKKSLAPVIAGASAIAFIAFAYAGVHAQQPAAGAGAGAAAAGRAGGRGAGGGIAPELFTAADMNRDGVVTRAELMSTIEHWYNDADNTHAGSVTEERLATVLGA